MNILLLTDGIPPFIIGGMQKHSSMLAKLFTELGHEVTLMHCVSLGTDIPSETDVNQAVFGRGSNVFLDEILGFHFPEPSKFPGHYIRASKSYSTLLLESIQAKLNTFDFIYAQGFTAWAFIKHKNQKPKTPPIFSNLHGLEMFQTAPSMKVKLQHFLLRPIAKYICRGSDYTFSFGGQLTEILQSIQVNPKAIIECSHGITSDWLTDDSNSTSSNLTNFIFIGRYERRKGIEELNEVLKELVFNEEFRFSFVGGIPEEKRISHPSITYHGKVNDYTSLKNLLISSDILMCPSYSEGMPTVIFEAMATANAIIATDVGAVNQQVSDNNGWLLSKSKTEFIKEAMLNAIHSPKNQLLNKKEHSVKTVSEKFIWEHVIKEKIRLIQKALNS